MKKEYCVYMHTTPSNKVYVGITGRKPNERWQNGKGYADNIHFVRAIKKYGWKNIKHEIIADGLTREQASELEKIYIALYDSMNPNKGYNLTTGGEANYYMTKEFSEKCSKRMKAKYSTKEGREEASKRSLKSWSNKEFKSKMTAIRKEVWQREDYRSKISASRTEENKRRWGADGDLRERMTGANSPVARPVEQYTKEGVFIKTYPSQADAMRALGIEKGYHISSCASGKRKTAYGFKWKYPQELQPTE